jgi:hypothetical protein
MRSSQKISAFTLVLTMLAGSLTGCGGAATEVAPIRILQSASTNAVTQPAATQAAPQPTAQSGYPIPQTPQPTGQPSQSPGNPDSTQPAATGFQGQVAVIMIKEGGVLNVRQSPGTSSTILETLPAHSSGLTLTGKTSVVGSEKWVEINRLTGGTGWVSAIYLTEYRPSSAFCGDAQVTQMLDAFKTAILNKDGGQLSALVSPLHGLTVEYLRGGKTVTYTPDKTAWLFTSTYVMDWGRNPASGKQVKGSFHEEVLPKLEDVLSASYTPACNNIQLGGASYKYKWPYEYGNINFYGLYRAGAAGKEQNWRTWLVGIEYVSGKPTLFSLVQLFWEP